jgi:EAL domain-containing protein (putative c-di-GMP-specific phosphodiesterase class I)
MPSVVPIAWLSFVRSVASLGLELGLRVTAEGVESAEHLAMVRKAGCTEAQGYLLGHPEPLSALDFTPACGAQHLGKMI